MTLLIIMDFPTPPKTGGDGRFELAVMEALESWTAGDFFFPHIGGQWAAKKSSWQDASGACDRSLCGKISCFGGEWLINGGKYPAKDMYDIPVSYCSF